jgi:hypothetical protein
LAWEVRPADHGDPTTARVLVNRLGGTGYLVGDSNFDGNRLHETAARRHHQLVAPRKRRGRGLGQCRHSAGRLRALELLTHPFGAALYRRRSFVERCFGHLTSFGGGLGPLPCWVRRLHRVKRWAQAIMSATDTDRAIVVGVNWYPGLTNLDGPLNDARAFRDWLVSGGGLGASQVRLILSPDPPPAAGAPPQPLVAEVQDTFNELDDLAQASAAQGRGLRAGRRLYLYFSGHGFAPLLGQTALYQVALLMANATRQRVGYHILGRAYADWFFRAGYFDEILLFMDCCREAYPLAPLNPPHFADKNDPNAVNRVRYFYGFGTKWSRLSRERPMPQFRGQVRGVFTTALLAGLNGAAADPTGRVTAASLRNYLFAHMQDFLSDADRTNANVPKEPDSVPYPDDGSQLVIVDGLGPATVTVRPAGGPPDVRVRLRDGAFQPVAPEAAPPAAGPPVWTFRLMPGRYLAERISADGQQVLAQQVIELTTERSRDVSV